MTFCLLLTKVEKFDLLIINGDKSVVIVSHRGIGIYKGEIPAKRSHAKKAYQDIVDISSAELFGEEKENGSISSVDPNLMSLFAPQNQPFLISWMNLDPIKEITKVKIPTLIINGDKDIQVQISDAENLKEAKPDATLVIIKNMNHPLKNIEKDEDNLKSYMSADYTISNELIETIENFIKK